jgi:hypothetical protein
MASASEWREHYPIDLGDVFIAHDGHPVKHARARFSHDRKKMHIGIFYGALEAGPDISLMMNIDKISNMLDVVRRAQGR